MATNKQRKTVKAPSSVAKDFTTIMNETTRDMSTLRRTLSRFIHTPWIARSSAILASTVARPNAILFGAVASFAFTLVVYLLSKNLGYSLSGFESIGAFIVGWIAGIVFDVVTHALKSN